LRAWESMCPFGIGVPARFVRAVRGSLTSSGFTRCW
jgi:hypothetical protein